MRLRHASQFARANSGKIDVRASHNAYRPFCDRDPSPPAPASRGFEPMGSGAISNGNCVCKKHCDQFAKAGQLARLNLAQCKSDCEQKYAGCNKGAMR